MNTFADEIRNTLQRANQHENDAADFQSAGQHDLADNELIIVERLRKRVRIQLWATGFRAWVGLQARPEERYQAEGWDAAAKKNESGGNRPTLIEAIELNPHARL